MGMIFSRDSLTQPGTLAANARGEVTAQQRAALRAALARRGFAALAGLAAGVACAGAAYAWKRGPSAGALPQLLAAGALAAAGIVLAARALWRVARAWRALGQDAVVPAGIGDVEWRRGTGIALLDGARLEAAEPLRLPPGEYRFYCLEGTRWLLSAEARELRGLDEALAQANGLRIESYADNREGRLAPEQRIALVGIMLATGGTGLLLTVVWLALVGYLVGSIDAPAGWPATLLVITIIALFFWWFLVTA